MAARPDAVDLSGQRALVTGGGSGIGAGTAKALAAAGAQVLVNYAHNRDKAEAVVAEITESGGDAFCYQADVSQEQDVEKMFAAMCERYGSVDVLVNNAGIQQDVPVVDMSKEDWDQVIAVNLTGQFLCARAAAREFLRRGRDPEHSRALGKIICISSVHDRIPWGGHANYAASKGGVVLFMKSLAQQLAPEGIRVNAISPGAIKTAINEDAWSTPEGRRELLKLIPYGRIGEPEDVARVAVWLASDLADYITGTVLYVDGGMSLYPSFMEDD